MTAEVPDTRTRKALLPGKLVADLRHFWTWWTRELKAMVPRALRTWLLPREGRLLLYPTAEGLRVRYTSNEDSRELGLLPEASDQAPLPTGIMDIMHSVCAITLCWPLDDGLLRSVSLPAETRERLADVIGFELDRLTPFRAEQVYFAHRIIGQDAQANTIEAEIQVIPRRAADRIIGGLADRGLKVSALVLGGGDTQDTFQELNLAPELARTRAAAGGRRPYLLLAATASLLVIALAIPQYRNLQRVEHLEQVLETERAGALAASQMRDALQSLREEGKRFARRRAENPTLVETLDELSRVMPDGTWLTSAEIRQDRARIQGLSDSASGLIAQVESSPLFRNAEFTAPVTHDQGRNLDQFVLETRVARREGEP